MSMNWYTTEQELNLVKKAFEPEPDPTARKLAKSVANSTDEEVKIQEATKRNNKSFDRLSQWWKDH